MPALEVKNPTTDIGHPDSNPPQNIKVSFKLTRNSFLRNKKASKFQVLAPYKIASPREARIIRYRNKEKSKA